MTHLISPKKQSTESHLKLSQKSGSLGLDAKTLPFLSFVIMHSLSTLRPQRCVLNVNRIHFNLMKFLVEKTYLGSSLTKHTSQMRKIPPRSA